MKKIPTLFQRNYEGDRLVFPELVPGTEWVLAGEGIATLKVDGTCCKFEGDTLYKRYELKNGKPTPPDFQPVQEPDPVTGDIPGWMPVGCGPEDRYHREALDAFIGDNGHVPEDGTYELVGPKIQSNPGGYPSHQLVRHGTEPLEVPRSFEGLRTYLQGLYDAGNYIEGIVFWQTPGSPESAMVKIKAKDFGIKAPKKR